MNGVFLLLTLSVASLAAAREPSQLAAKLKDDSSLSPSAASGPFSTCPALEAVMAGYINGFSFDKPDLDITLPVTTNGKLKTFTWQHTWGVNLHRCYNFRAASNSYAYLFLTGYAEYYWDYTYMTGNGWMTYYINAGTYMNSGGSAVVAFYNDYIIDFGYTHILNYRTGRDVTPPTIYVSGGPAAQWTFETPSTDGVYIELSTVVTGSDMANANIANPAPKITCVKKPGNTLLPMDGVMLPMGVTTIVCTASDAAGNVNSDPADGTITVLVQDTIKPILTVSQSPIIVAADATTGAGMVVLSDYVTANDTASIPVITCKKTSGGSNVPITGFAFPVGITALQCTATDGGGNTAVKNVVVKVNDVTPPTLTAPTSPVLVEAKDRTGVTMRFPVSATDAVTPSPTITCVRTSDNKPVPVTTKFPFGTTTYICSATDKAGNKVTSDPFDITVQDTTAPVFTVSLPASFKAPNSNGATVKLNKYVSVKDAVTTKLTIVCTLSDGTPVSLTSYRFPIGTSTVTCTATDDYSNVGTTGPFVVVVAA